MADETLERTQRAVSRRAFIKTVVAGGAGVASANYLFRPSALLGQGTVAGGGRLITITVNGRQRRVDVMKQETLAWTLRYKLGLAGTKLGCNRAECGACTVLLDGDPTRSCVTPLKDVGQEEVTTIEGLGTIEKPHPLQKAFIEEQAAQCGYCLNGMIMTAKELLVRIPHPTETDIRHELARNLCRCGTHNRIVRAIMRAAQASGGDHP